MLKTKRIQQIIPFPKRSNAQEYTGRTLAFRPPTRLRSLKNPPLFNHLGATAIDQLTIATSLASNNPSISYMQPSLRMHPLHRPSGNLSIIVLAQSHSSSLLVRQKR